MPFPGNEVLSIFYMTWASHIEIWNRKTYFASNRAAHFRSSCVTSTSAQIPSPISRHRSCNLTLEVWGTWNLFKLDIFRWADMGLYLLLLKSYMGSRTSDFTWKSNFHLFLVRQYNFIKNDSKRSFKEHCAVSSQRFPTNFKLKYELQSLKTILIFKLVCTYRGWRKSSSNIPSS